MAAKFNSHLEIRQLHRPDESFSAPLDFEGERGQLLLEKSRLSLACAVHPALTANQFSPLERLLDCQRVELRHQSDPRRPQPGHERVQILVITDLTVERDKTETTFDRGPGSSFAADLFCLVHGDPQVVVGVLLIGPQLRPHLT